jgi:hypothetical protein
MRENKMKIINLFLIVCLYLTAQPFVSAQTELVYKADLLVSDGKNFNARPVEIFIDGDAIKIRGKKKPFETKIIPFSDIQDADYTYSDKPRYTVATLSTLALGVGALPLFADKTKKNWLTVITEKNSVILQLQSKNYRMLLLQLRAKGIKITDSGDRDEKDKNQKKLNDSALEVQRFQVD